MFKSIVAAALIAFSSTAFSASTYVDTDKLTESQIQELKATAAALAAKNVKRATEGPSPDEVMTFATTWGNQAAAAAEGFAKAIGIAAKELNVSVNSFITTPAGQLTVAVIIWKVAGHGLAMLFIGLPLGIFLFRLIYLRMFTKSEEVVPVSYLWGFINTQKKVRKMKSMSDLSEGTEFLGAVALVGIAAGTFIMIMTL